MASINSQNTIIVPVNVQAICVGKNDAQKPNFIKRNADFSLLPYRDGNQTFNQHAYISEHILNPPFESNTQQMSEGIHLHWALPDALTHATINDTIDQDAFDTVFGEDSGEKIWIALVAKNWIVPFPNASSTSAKFSNVSLLPTENQTLDLDPSLKIIQNEVSLFLEQYRMNFPNVPNRWMVTRICYSSDSPSVQSHKSWVIESDFLSADDTNQGVKKTNTTVPYKSNEQDASPKPYRYMGEKFEYNNYWTPNNGEEYYPKLTAIGYGDIEFAGYYPNCSTVFGFHDDLSDLQPTEDQQITYQVSGWYSNLDHFSNDPFHLSSSQKPETVLNEFNWSLPEGKSTSISDSLYSGIVSGIVWNVNTDYITNDTVPDIDIALAPNEKEALTALSQSSSTHQYLLNTFLLEAETKLDRAEGLFETKNAIHNDRFTKIKNGQLWNVKKANQEVTLMPPENEKELPGDISTLLVTINGLQEKFNKKSAEIISMRERIFADWYKYMVERYDPTPSRIDETTRPSFWDIREFIENQEIPALNTLFSQLNEVSGDLNTQLTALNTLLNRKYSKDSYEISRSVAPIYYQGNDPVVLLKSKSDGWKYAGNRNTISDESLVCRLSSDILSDTNISTISLPQLSSEKTVPFADIINSLLNEAVILSFYSYAQADSKITSGKLPEQMSVTNWDSNPWLVMQLHWKIDYKKLLTQTEEQYESSYITNNYQFDSESSELDFIKGNKFSIIPDSLRGKSLLTPQVKESLQRQIDRVLTLYSDHDFLPKKLNTLKASIADTSILSQTLNGFNDALVMKKKTLQLKVNNPLRAVFDDSFNDAVQIAVSEENRAAPLPLYQYNPIRTGLIKVDHLRIVDAFGRFKNIDTSNVMYPKNMTLDSPNVGYKAQLPLRITQPARLSFDYLKADSETQELIKYTGANPVCGWIVLNLLENAFMIYNADGSSLGSLRTSHNSDINTVLWQGAPGKISEGIEQDLADANQFLKNFVLAIKNNGVSFFHNFLKSIDNAQSFIGNKSFRQDLGLVPLIGEPIALVRANISLELLGLPQINESWSALQDNINNNNALQRTTEGFTKVKFPAIVGSYDRHSDGLYGFFKGDGPDDFDTFYTYGKGIPTSNSPTQITLTPDDEDTVTLSMLVQPSNPVHLKTGILPEASVDLPFEYCVDAMNRIAATFLTSPILVDKDELRVPLSKEKGSEWTFISNLEGQWSQTDESILDASDQATYSTSERKLLEGWLQLSKEQKG